MFPRRTGQRPLPLPKLQPVFRRNGSLSSLDNTPSTGSPPSPNFPPVNSVKSIDIALKSAEDRLRSELNGLRVSCSQALMGEQLRAEKLHAQSIAYQRERDFAWAKVKALMAEKMGIQPYPSVQQRRSRSCGALSRARSLGAAVRPSRPLSPRVSAHPESYLHPSASSSASCSTSSLTQVKKEEQPVSLPSSRSSSPTSPQASPSDTLCADGAWDLKYPGPSSPKTDVTALPPLKRCHSDSSMLKACPFQWIELPGVTRVPLTRMNKAQSYVLNKDHLDVLFKEHNNQLICRMCILERKKVDEAKQDRFPVAHFDVDVLHLAMYTHCLERHPKESEEMAKLPHSMLLEMQKGLARTDRDDDFDLDYTLID